MQRKKATKIYPTQNKDNENFDLKPFLMWAGGKRWFIKQHSTIFPDNFNQYIEPFLGSGAVFFKIKPAQAILSDINKELIDTYSAIKKNWEEVFSRLKKHHSLFNKDYYYKIRLSEPQDLYDKAARLIFLNRTCWNGLYRVNNKGQFNVPIGTKVDVVREDDNFAAISKILQNANLQQSDFEDIIDKAKENDLLFVDPPYTVRHNDNGFIKYNEQIFSWEDQIRLSEAIVRAKKRGAKVILTNANHKSIKKLYKNDFELLTVARKSILSGKSEYRGTVSELIVMG